MTFGPWRPGGPPTKPLQKVDFVENQNKTSEDSLLVCETNQLVLLVGKLLFLFLPT
jgi:hypothetical protein